MVRERIDYRALFAATPSPYLVLGRDLVIVAVNRAYLLATARTRAELVGRYIFDAFPDNPADPDADGVRNLSASLHWVLRSKEPDTMAVQKYDIPVTGRPGTFEERWWSPINTPVLGPDGQVEWIIHRVEDVTEFVMSRLPRERWAGVLGEREAMEAELYARARELQQLNEELRKAHARERQIAVTLQEAMLQSPDLAGHQDIAVRYMPAAGSLNVCGDWYDVVDLPGGFGVAVGDVVGHGLEAAAAMGMLRSACPRRSAPCTSRPERWRCWACMPARWKGRWPPPWSRPSSTTRATASATAARAISRPFWCTPAAPSNCSTRPPTPRWAPDPAMCPAPRPSCLTSRETPSCSTPTGSSNAGGRTSTSVCAGSPTLSPATPVLLPNAWPTCCSPASVSAAADATTSPWSSYASSAKPV